MSDGLCRIFWRHRSLTIELVKREFTARYRGSFGGVLWSFAQPLFLLCVYTIAFGVILQARWGLSGNTREYAFMLFAGLIVFNAFAECLRKAPSLVTMNPNFVKKVVFPLEILPWVMALGALVHALLGIAVWLAGYVVVFGAPKLTVLYCPFVVAALFPVLLGVGWLLAALGVYARDISQLTELASHALLFLTPVFYSVDAVPGAYRTALMMNPLTFIVEQFRRVMFAGLAPDLAGLGVYLFVAVIFSWASLYVFRRLRPFFADLV